MRIVQDVHKCVYRIKCPSCGSIIDFNYHELFRYSIRQDGVVAIQNEFGSVTPISKDLKVEDYIKSEWKPFVRWDCPACKNGVGFPEEELKKYDCDTHGW